MFDTLSRNSPSSSLRSKSVRKIHPAFDESDSEDDGGAMTKAMQFQLALRQETESQDLNTSPLSSTLSREGPHSKLLHAIESPFKRLPKHILHFHHDSKPQFLIINKAEPPTEPPQSESKSRSVPALASTVAVPPALKIQPPSPTRPAPVSSPRLRPRRYTISEAPRELHGAPEKHLMLRRYRSFDFGPGFRTRDRSLRQEQRVQESIPGSNQVTPPWSASTDSTRVVFTGQSSKFIEAPDIGEFPSTPVSSIIVPDFPEPPLGLARFEKPKLMLRTTDLAVEQEAQWTPQKPGSAVQERRQKLRKPQAATTTTTREIKISAPASLDNDNSFLDLEVVPRTPPLPPSSSASVTFKGNNNTVAVIEDRRASGENTTEALPIPTETETTKKKPRLAAVAKVAGKLLRSHSQARSSRSQSVGPGPTPTPNVVLQQPLSLPPLLYSTSTPIQQHILAVSARIKDEFKLKLNKEIDLPLADAATEEELVQQLQDVNDDIGRCAKEIARLLARSTPDKKESKSAKGKNSLTLQGQVRTSLNSFLVTRVFQPFSIQLTPEDDDAVRERYDMIAPSVPQFIASRWRVVASASTSRPVQELGEVLENLAGEASIEILGERSSEVDLSKETAALLVPLIRHAYLLAHFNHLEMLTSDYDIFAGTDIGGWIIPSQEEEKLHSRHSIAKSQDGRVTGYWTLGLRKKRYVGEGPLQRRVWDVLLKSQVLTSRTL